MEPTAHQLVNPQDTDESQSLESSLPEIEPTSDQLKLLYEESEDTITETEAVVSQSKSLTHRQRNTISQ